MTRLGGVAFHAYELGPDGMYKLAEQGQNDDTVTVTLTIGSTEVPATVSCASLLA